MRPKRISLTQHLIEENRRYGTVPEELRLLLEVVCRACKIISTSSVPISSTLTMPAGHAAEM